MRRLLVAVGVELWIVGATLGHHAMEYIEMESYSTAKHGEKVFHLHYDYIVDDSDNNELDHWEFTPGISYGITDRVMLDVHTHFAKFGLEHVVEDRRAEFEPNGPSPFIEAMAISLQCRLTDGWLVNFGLLGSWESAFDRAKEILGSEDHVYEATLIASYEFGEHGNVCANLNYAVEGDDDEWSWAVGMKNPISADPHGIAAGVEFMGDFEGNRWSVLPGVYMPISDTIVLKTGIEFGQERGEAGEWNDTCRANVTMLYRF